MKELREERTREIPLGPGFVPGDVVGIEMGALRHRRGLKGVVAVFEKDGAGGDGGYPSQEIALRGRLERAPLRRHPSGGGRISRVTLSAIVPDDAVPGEYRCRRLEAETSEGTRVAFEPITDAAWRGWRFRVQ